jgi:hypothetical protein
MSLYSLTENNIQKNTSSDYLDFNKRPNKFNSTYYFPRKFSQKSFSQIRVPTRQNPLITENYFLTPKRSIKSKTSLNKITNIKSYKDLKSLSKAVKKIKNKFNPEILVTEYISQPKRNRQRNKKITNLDIPKYNTFLGNKEKTKSFNFKTFNIINGNINESSTLSYCNRSNVNRLRDVKNFKLINKLNYKKINYISESIKLLIERANKNNKRAADKTRNQFKQRLINDKRENLKEYNKYMSILQLSLNNSKSKEKNMKRL